MVEIAIIRPRPEIPRMISVIRGWRPDISIIRVYLRKLTVFQAYPKTVIHLRQMIHQKVSERASWMFEYAPAPHYDRGFWPWGVFLRHASVCLLVDSRDSERSANFSNDTHPISHDNLKSIRRDSILSWTRERHSDRSSHRTLFAWPIPSMIARHLSCILWPTVYRYSLGNSWICTKIIRVISYATR
jgi:hypothetical protein